MSQLLNSQTVLANCMCEDL